MHCLIMSEGYQDISQGHLCMSEVEITCRMRASTVISYVDMHPEYSRETLIERRDPNRKFKAVHK